MGYMKSISVAQRAVSAPGRHGRRLGKREGRVWCSWRKEPGAFTIVPMSFTVVARMRMV